MIRRLSQNPLLLPEEKWEEKGAFNPSVLKSKDGYQMLYRAVDDKGISRIAVAESKNGLDWKRKKLFIVPSEEWDCYGCEDPRVTYLDKKYYIFYTAISLWPPRGEGIKLGLAVSPDLERLEEKRLITPFNAKAAGLFSEKVDGKYALALSVNTDFPPSRVGLALAEKIEYFWKDKFWEKWFSEIEKNEINFTRLNNDHAEVGALPVKTKEGWLWIYSHIADYYRPEKAIFGIEAVLTAIQNPTQIIARTANPLMVPQAEYEIFGPVKRIIFPSSVTDEGKKWRIYYGAADGFGAGAEVGKEELGRRLKTKGPKVILKMKKHGANPVLVSNENHHWEGKAVFNPALVYEQGEFYLIYRALSPELVSTLGCAVSKDGYHFYYRSAGPIYVPRMDYEQKRAERNYSGCEDPRLVKLNDRFYLFYTAYDGVNPPRVALSWITVENFVHHNWLWSEPILISPPGEDNKDTCLFPEKIGGKYLILHRAGGKDIMTDWLDDLRHFDGLNWLENEESIGHIAKSWEGEKIGIGAPPLKTKEGWLLFYHGVSDIDHQYRAGAMLLDLENPAKVLARTKYPLLEPTEEFEKRGITDNVVFPCGAVEVEGVIYLAYGGADKAIGLATIKKDKLLGYLEENKTNC